MHGNLEPDERLLDDVWDEDGILDLISHYIDKLGWEYTDDISVEIGGTAVSGIDVGEVYNKKWQSPKGTRKYNKDAFIIIKNQSRRDLSKSEAPETPIEMYHSQEGRYEDVQ